LRYSRCARRLPRRRLHRALILRTITTITGTTSIVIRTAIAELFLFPAVLTRTKAIVRSHGVAPEQVQVK